MNKILDYFQTTDIRNLCESEKFRELVERIEQARALKVLRYHILGKSLILYTSTDVLKWRIRPRGDLYLSSLGKVHEVNFEDKYTFKHWLNSDNVVKLSGDQYREQTTQWKKIFTLEEIREFYNREYKG
jgi:hypothetical protein